MAVVFFYAVLGGMKGITYTQVAQYCVMIFAYITPAIFVSLLVTGTPCRNWVWLPRCRTGPVCELLEKLDQVLVDLGFAPYTDGSKSMIDVFTITLVLMAGTAGLPHVIVRFFTVPRVSDARKSRGVCPGIHCPAVHDGAGACRLRTADFHRHCEQHRLHGSAVLGEDLGGNRLVVWLDKNEDGVIQYAAGDAFEGAPVFTGGAG